MRFLAEYLSRIGSISVTSDIEDTLVIWEGARIRFGSAEFALPAEANPGQSRQAGRVRLRIPAKREPQINPSTPEVWNAKYFSNCQGIHCISCGRRVLHNPLRWRQKPSENWTELMDLWHCHKPISHEVSDVNNIYGNPVNLVPRPGTVLVGENYIEPHYTDFDPCEHLHGIQKIWMWDIKLDDGTIMNPDVLISFSLLALIDSHAIYSFLLNKKLLVWIFNCDISFTTSSRAGRGLKVLFADEGSKINDLRQLRPEIENVELPDYIFSTILQSLRGNFMNLPSDSQWFGEWKVSFLSYT